MTKAELITKLKSTMWASGAHSDTDTMNLMEEIIADVTTLEEPPTLGWTENKPTAPGRYLRDTRGDMKEISMALIGDDIEPNHPLINRPGYWFGPIPEGPRSGEEMS